MILVPCWDDSDGDDTLISRLVDALLDHVAPLGPDADLRAVTGRVREALGFALTTCYVGRRPGSGGWEPRGDCAGSRGGAGGGAGRKISHDGSDV